MVDNQDVKEIEKITQQQIQKLTLSCSNCGAMNEIEIEKGKRIKHKGHYFYEIEEVI